MLPLLLWVILFIQSSASSDLAKSANRHALTRLDTSEHTLSTTAALCIESKYGSRTHLSGLAIHGFTEKKNWLTADLDTPVSASTIPLNHLRSFVDIDFWAS